MSASAIIADVRSLLAGEPVFLAGSLVAAETYGKDDAFSDVDIFCPTPQVLVATGQRLLMSGFTLDDRFGRVWQRWLRYGFKTWHTNSLRMTSPGGDEYNLVYKLADGHPTTSLSQVLESFDFGLLGTGYDLETNKYMDLRSYLFPDLYYNVIGQVKHMADALPLMPNKRSNWRNGFISQYNGIREAGRYAKYHQYGYDMSLVADDLATGYEAAWLYHHNSFDTEKQTLGKIYDAIAQHIRAGHIDELAAASKLIDYKDSLDQIMEALE